MAAATEPNGLWNSQKTVYKTFGTSGRPTQYNFISRPFVSPQYLEWRFDKKVRLLGAACFTLQMVLYMAIVVYTPALALSQGIFLSMNIMFVSSFTLRTFFFPSVTGMDVDLACAIIFIVCIFYTAAVRERKSVREREKIKYLIVMIFTGRDKGRHVDGHLPSGRHVRLLPCCHHQGQR